MVTTGSAVVLVEGESDRRAVLTLAPRLGVPVPEVVVMHGITNLRAHLAARHGAVLLLHDAAETTWVGRVLTDTTRPDLQVATFVCDVDLEDELVRAVGVRGVLAVVVEQGERAAYERMAQQPAQRDRTDAQRLRRWLGARSGHKTTYAGLLAGAVPLDRVPVPLRSLLAAADAHDQAAT
ncbi:ATP-dependent endonuclease [Nocardioides rubriscoriae]|uniref:ATP-dependent endonuclease n=1 Tax=Nocardioides rubriscoriae TaxID=642762 RepID=UPI0011DFF82E|nr:ATP-dependent endonuclease [Nocardioides rubriscoriae]